MAGVCYFKDPVLEMGSATYLWYNSVTKELTWKETPLRNYSDTVNGFDSVIISTNGFAVGFESYIDNGKILNRALLLYGSPDDDYLFW